MSGHKFQKVLIANRGEIAIRIFRACYDLELRTVAMYSNEDTYSLFRTRADEAYLIGENQSPLGAYLDIPAIIDLAKRRQVDAIHPGYGFLSENADFARACEEAGITFIGPNSSILAQMGDKLAAKATAIACGVPTIPGSTEPLKDADEAVEKALSYGFPIILKAAAGGGGRGMRRCDSEEDVRREFELVKNEARKAFGNEDIFIEKYAAIIDAALAANQDCLVYVQSILPVSAAKDAGGTWCNNANVNARNERLKELAEEKGVYYLDVASAFRGEDGCLPAGDTPDGIHLTPGLCVSWLDYLKTHTVTEETP